MELNFTEILITCTYFTTLCSKQARSPRGSCQHSCVAPRRFNNKCIDYSFRDLQLTWCLRVMRFVDRVICGGYWRTTFPTWKRRLNKWKCAATERFEFWLYLSSSLFNCNLFTHGALGSSWELVETCPCVPDRIGIWKCWFLRRRENQSTRRKNSRSKGILSGNLFGEESSPPPPPKLGGGGGGLSRGLIVE